MKKIISFVLALTLLLALAVPAWAAAFSSGSNIPDGNYDNINITGTVTVTGKATIIGHGRLNIDNKSTLVIGGTGSLEGVDVGLSIFGDTKVKIESGGKIDITFTKESCSNQFAALLTDNGYKYTKKGNEIIYPVCEHKNTEIISENKEETVTVTETTPVTTNRKYCKDCGDLLETEEVRGETVVTRGETVITETEVGEGGTASTLSEGNMTIICTVAAAAIFGVGGFVLGRKKQKAEVE